MGRESEQTPFQESLPVFHEFDPTDPTITTTKGFVATIRSDPNKRPLFVIPVAQEEAEIWNDTPTRLPEELVVKDGDLDTYYQIITTQGGKVFLYLKELGTGRVVKLYQDLGALSPEANMYLLELLQQGFYINPNSNLFKWVIENKEFVNAQVLEGLLKIQYFLVNGGITTKGEVTVFSEPPNLGTIEEAGVRFGHNIGINNLRSYLIELTKRVYMPQAKLAIFPPISSVLDIQSYATTTRAVGVGAGKILNRLVSNLTGISGARAHKLTKALVESLLEQDQVVLGDLALAEGLPHTKLEPSSDSEPVLSLRPRENVTLQPETRAYEFVQQLENNSERLEVIQTIAKIQTIIANGGVILENGTAVVFPEGVNNIPFVEGSVKLMEPAIAALFKGKTFTSGRKYLQLPNLAEFKYHLQNRTLGDFLLENPSVNMYLVNLINSLKQEFGLTVEAEHLLLAAIKDLDAFGEPSCVLPEWWLEEQAEYIVGTQKELPAKSPLFASISTYIKGVSYLRRSQGTLRSRLYATPDEPRGALRGTNIGYIPRDKKGVPYTEGGTTGDRRHSSAELDPINDTEWVIRGRSPDHTYGLRDVAMARKS